jgi:hypothetical protein
MIKNYQVSDFYYIRLEDDVNDDVILTLIWHDKLNVEFKNHANVFIPKQQRNNIADFIRVKDE